MPIIYYEYKGYTLEAPHTGGGHIKGKVIYYPKNVKNTAPEFIGSTPKEIKQEFENWVEQQPELLDTLIQNLYRRLN